MKCRRILAILILICLLTCGSAMAAAKRYFVSYGDTGDVVGDLQDIIGVSESYYDEYTRRYIPHFSTRTRTALRAIQKEYGLTVNGRFDDETMYLILDLPYQTAENDPDVWIPMHGGTRYHWLPNCSGIYDAREMPMSCAAALGFLPCAKCFK